MRTPRLIGCGVLAGLLSVVVPAQSARRNARLDRVLDGLIVDLGRQEAMGDAYERLLAIGKPAVPRLLRAVLPGVGTAQLRWRRALALRLLGDLGPHSVAALDPLIQAMWQLGGWDRDECMRAIARIAPYSRRSMQDLGLGTSTVGRYWLDAEICAARVEFGPRPDPKQVAAALIADYRSGVARQRMVRSFAALQLLADGACPAFRDRDGVLARAFDATRQGIYIYTTSVVDLRWLKECAALALVRHARESDLRSDALAMLLAHPRASVARSAFRELQPELDSGGERAVGLLKRGIGALCPDVQMGVLRAVPRFAGQLWFHIAEVARYVESPDRRVAQAASATLAVLQREIELQFSTRGGVVRPEHLVAWWREPRLEAQVLAWMPRLAGRMHPWLPELVRATRHPDPERRRLAVLATFAVESALAKQIGSGLEGQLACHVARVGEVEAGCSDALTRALRHDRAPLQRLLEAMPRRGWAPRRICAALRVVERVGVAAAPLAGDVLPWCEDNRADVAVAALQALAAIGPDLAEYLPDFRRRLAPARATRSIPSGDRERVAAARDRCLACLEVRDGTPAQLASLLDDARSAVRERALELLAAKRLDQTKDAEVLRRIAGAVTAEHPASPGPEDLSVRIRTRAARILVSHLGNDADLRFTCASALLLGGTADERRWANQQLVRDGKPRVQDLVWQGLFLDDPAAVIASLDLLCALRPKPDRFRMQLRLLAEGRNRDVAARAQAAQRELGLAR